MAAAWPGLVATFAVFTRWTNVELQITVGSEHRQGLMQDVLVGNTEYHNGGMRLTSGRAARRRPVRRAADRRRDQEDLALNLHKLYRGTFLPHPRAELLRGATVTVESQSPLPIELDGEQPGTTPAHFEVVPRALRVRVPAPNS